MGPPPRRSWLAYLCVMLLRLLLRAAFRIKASGLANVPAGSFILAGNHLGWLDPLVLVASLPPNVPLYIVGDPDAAAVVGTHWHMPLIRATRVVVPVDRSRPDRSVLEASLAILKRGDALAIFPEGTVGEREGDLLPLKRGIGFLALRSGCPLVPFALRGTSELFLGKEIDLVIGPSIYPELCPIEREAFKEASQRLTQEVADGIRALFPSAAPRPYRVKRWLWLTRLFS